MSADVGRGTGAWKSGRGYGETLPAGSERRIESAGDARSGIGDSGQVRSVVVVVVRGGDEQLGSLRGTGDFGDVLGVRWTGESVAGPIDAPGTQPQVRVDASWKARRHRYAAACANLLRALDRVLNTGLIVLAAAYSRRDFDDGIGGSGVKRRPFGHNTICVTSTRTRPVLPSFGIWGCTRYHSSCLKRPNLRGALTDLA